MRVLYKRTFNVPVSDLENFSDVQKDILLNWKPEYNLFSVTQLAERNGKSRGHVQRQVRKMVKMGLVERHCPKILNGK